jgi:hypothetical protein
MDEVVGIGGMDEVVGIGGMDEVVGVGGMVGGGCVWSWRCGWCGVCGCKKVLLDEGDDDDDDDDVLLAGCANRRLAVYSRDII